MIRVFMIILLMSLVSCTDDYSNTPQVILDNVSTFQLKIHRFPTTQYVESLELTTRLDSSDPEALSMQISEKEAELLVKSLIKSGYFDSAKIPVGAWTNPVNQPNYRISIQTKGYVSYKYIGHSNATLEELENLGKCLDKNASDALDKLCQSLKSHLK